MNILKDFTLKWWQAGIFKIAMLSIGIAIGSTRPESFKGWTAPGQANTTPKILTLAGTL
jgi:hypothetical protein